MKKSIVALCFVAGLLCTSCYSQFYQLMSAKSTTPDVEVLQNELRFANNDCVITYDLWSNKGNPGFRIHNKSDEMLYVDLSESFFVINGTAYDYYLNRTYTPPTMYYPGMVGNLPSYIHSNTASTNASTYASGTTQMKEKEVISIPPHSAKYVSEYTIISFIHHECGMVTNPREESREFVYTRENSPVVFSNIISYCKANGVKEIVRNEFYVNKIKNIAEKQFKKLQLLETRCEGHKKWENVDVYNFMAPDNFYLSYIPATDWVY